MTTSTNEHVPLRGQSAWAAGDLGGAVPTIDLDRAAATTLADATTALLDSGVGVEDLAAADAPLAWLAGVRDEIARLLDDGPGLVVVRGVPTGEIGDRGAAIAAYSVALALGTPLAQNRHGDRVYLVRDEQRDGYAGLRGSKTSGALIFHTDAASAFANSVPDTFGLLAVRRAREGGSSLALSGHTVYNRLLEQSPELIDPLFDAFCWDRAEEAQAGEDPVFVAPILEWRGSRLVVRYNRAWLAAGHKLAGQPLTERQRAALDAVDAIMRDESLVLSFDLDAGDLLLVNNEVVLHNRTAFVDDEEEGARRLLYRVWVRRHP